MASKPPKAGTLRDTTKSDLGVGDSTREDDYRKKKENLLEEGEYPAFNTSLYTHVTLNNKGKVKVLLKLAKEKKAMDKLPCVPELLRTAVMYSHNGYETIELIADMLPDQMLKVPPGTQETILHIAVARQDFEGAKLILEKWKGLENGNGLLHQFIHIPLEFTTKERHKSSESCQQVELPLSMAVWNQDIDMINLLLHYGASMRKVNSYGQNVFHSLVEVAANQKRKSSFNEINTTARTLMKNAASFNEINTTARNLMKNAAKSDGTTLQSAQNLSVILSEKDKQGYTPLTLSAKLGCRKMFEIIANCEVYKRLDTSTCVSDEYLYDVTEIDSAISDDRKSAMELIMKGGYRHVRQYYEFAELCPVLDLIRDKWNYYRWWYFSWGFVHALMMLLYTLGAVINTDGFLIPSIVFDCVLSLYSVLFSIQEIWLLVRWRDVGLGYGNELRNAPYRILMVLLAVSMSLTVIFRFSLEESMMMIPRSLSLIFGWLFTMFFTRGFKPFSSFTVMMQMAIGDVLRFTVIYSLVLVPYSASMTILFSTSTEDNKFNTFWKSTFTMFSLTLGLEEVNPLEATYHPQLATFLYITFLVTSYILLLNMMIALLSDTCSQVSSIRKDQWHLQKLGIVLYIEARIFSRHKHVCGKLKPVKLFQRNCKSSSAPQKPKRVDPHIIEMSIPEDSINHDTVNRYYFKVKTLNQRNVKEYRKSQEWRKQRGTDKQDPADKQREQGSKSKARESPTINETTPHEPCS